MIDLNIRAAKCLGWEILPDRIKPTYSYVNMNGGVSVWPFDKMKFKTSYDWAFKGIKPAIEADFYRWKVEIFKAIGGTRQFDPEINGERWEGDMTNMFLMTPEQIAQAWVEVLEANND